MKTTDILLAIIIPLVWGVNFVIAKFGLHHYPPMLLMGLRFAIVALCLLPFYWRTKVPHFSIIPMAIIYGVAYHTLVFTGLWQGLSVGAGIIAVQMHVPFTALLAVYWLKDPMGWRRIFGMIVAFSGLVIVVGNPSVTTHIEAFMLVLAGALCWAIYNIQVKQLKILARPFLAWFSLYSAILLIVSSLFTETKSFELLTTIPPYSAIGSLIYMAIFTTLIGMGLWSYLIGKYSVHQVTPFTLLAPFFGVISASLMLDEPLGWQIVIGGLLAIIGVGIIVIRRPSIAAEGEALS